MVAPHYRGALALMAAAVVATACTNNGTEPDNRPSAVAIVSGNDQVGLVGQALTSPLIVKVTRNSAPAPGVTVNFAVASGTATVAPAAATTDTSGQAMTHVTLGGTAGNVSITATVGGTQLVATFTATVGTGTVTLACSSSAPTTPAAGSVLPSVSGTGICLGGGTAGAEYALVAFYGNPDSSLVQNFTVTGQGASPVATPNLVPSFNIARARSLGGKAPHDLRDAFDAALRDRARRDLTPLMPAARQRMNQRQRLAASFNVIPPNPTVGSFVTLNAQALQACSQINNRTGRVAAVSTKAIVVADTGNPAGGFTDAEYAGFAAMFDTLISPLDIANFGAPSDIDNNGKVVMFFTKEVNALTSRTATGVVGGFFFERDLFPLQDDNTLQLPGCAGSNVAEMFYLLVPDPDGLVSKAHTKADVADLTPGTIVHEFQHLINAGRRLYVNNADTFEDTWLNEGLSHVAEELLYYRVAGFAPRQNIDSTKFTTQAAVNAFNSYQADNTARYEIFLEKPNLTSVYGSGDELETRGATWNLLRYLADHRGTSDGDVWMQLANSQTAGQRNLRNVFGADYLTQIGNWAISVLADDVPGVTDARFLEQSWNMRGIFPRLCANSGCTTRLGKYPLAVIPLAQATPASVTVNAGGAAYLRFSVAGGSQASIDWSANGLPVSGLMSFTVVRTK
jgi:hypothetical protein